MVVWVIPAPSSSTETTILVGTFSIVYKAVSLAQGKIVALKRIRRTSAPARIERELKFLIDLKGEEFVLLPRYPLMMACR